MLGSGRLGNVHALLLPAPGVLPQGGELLCRPVTLPDRFPAVLAEILCPHGRPEGCCACLQSRSAWQWPECRPCWQQSVCLWQAAAEAGLPGQAQGADPLFCVEATMTSTGKACWDVSPHEQRGPTRHGREAFSWRLEVCAGFLVSVGPVCAQLRGSASAFLK